jgi:hypothetical protein
LGAVSNFAQVVKFRRMYGTAIPAWLTDLFDGLDEDPETRKLVAAMVATEQCRALAAKGVDQFRFYRLNRADLTLGICRRLGLKPASVTVLAGRLAADTPRRRRGQATEWLPWMPAFAGMTIMENAQNFRR